MLQAALSRAATRHAVLLGNLANVSTPGYKRRDISFAVSLRDADALGPLRRTHPKHAPAPTSPKSWGATADEDLRSIRSDGNSVDLETEVAALVETQLHFSALTMVARRYFQGLREVIREGR